MLVQRSSKLFSIILLSTLMSGCTKFKCKHPNFFMWKNFDTSSCANECEGDDCGQILVQEDEFSIVTVSPKSVQENTPFDLQIQIEGLEQKNGAWPAVFVTVQQHKLSATIEDGGKSLTVQVPGMSAGQYDVKVSSGESIATRHRALEVLSAKDSFPKECEKLIVYFDLAQFNLDNQDLQYLEEKKHCWERENAQIHMVGHCDDRGTTEYNMQLGQNRANAVYQYFGSQGISEGILSKDSKGEDQPADRGNSETAYAKNRRVEIIITP